VGPAGKHYAIAEAIAVVCAAASRADFCVSGVGVVGCVSIDGNYRDGLTMNCAEE
jgi:hypothetical protein